jgi:hypothetical protein
MTDDPKMELKSAITVQGKQNVKDLALIVANTRKTGALNITVSQGGAVAATFEEKIVLDKNSAS